jgi:hypothetical protein
VGSVLVSQEQNEVRPGDEGCIPGDESCKCFGILVDVYRGRGAWSPTSHVIAVIRKVKALTAKDTKERKGRTIPNLRQIGMAWDETDSVL